MYVWVFPCLHYGLQPAVRKKNDGSTSCSTDAGSTLALKGTHANCPTTGGISEAQVLLQQTTFHINMAHYLDSHIFSAYINGIAPFTLKNRVRHRNC